jgi:hypothetical protein
MNPALRTALTTLAVFALNACAARPHVDSTVNSAVRRTLAARAFSEGVASFDRGEFARALASFDVALEVEPHPVVQFDLARVHDAMGHDTAAARAYIAFLNAPGATNPALAETAREALSRLRPRIAWLRLRAPTGARVGDQVIEASDAEQLVPIDPGLRLARINGHGTISVRARAGEVFVLDAARPGDPIEVSAGEFDSSLCGPRSSTTAMQQR